VADQQTKLGEHELEMSPDLIARLELLHGPGWREVTFAEDAAARAARIADLDQGIAADLDDLGEIDEHKRIAQALMRRNAEGRLIDDELIEEVVAELYGADPSKRELERAVEVLAHVRARGRGENPHEGPHGEGR
jgi:single-stranded DNA-specific DHH superfamily exonuclease